jgi:DNA-binding sugar fermentation-stimulating protein
VKYVTVLKTQHTRNFVFLTLDKTIKVIRCNSAKDATYQEVCFQSLNKTVETVEMKCARHFATFAVLRASMDISNFSKLCSLSVL